MSTEENIEKGVGVLTELVSIAKDSPEGKQAAKNVGKTAVTLTTFVNNALIPLAVVNFGFQKAREYFETRFSDEFEPYIKLIPKESLIEPKPSIAGPALQGLSFSYDEDSLKQMYLNLLANNMDSRHSEDCHPAFVDVIKQMTAEEAELFQMLISKGWRGIAQIWLKLEEGHRLLHTHLIPLHNSETGEPEINKNLPSMVTNWIRLGLIEVDYNAWLTSKDAYAWIEERPEYKELLSNETESRKLESKKGLLTFTPFGTKFAIAVGIRPSAFS